MPIPVVTVSQMRDWEKATWAAGRTESGVISRVGHIVAARAMQMTRPGDLILVLAGKGHNGDDARHASQNLPDREIYLINVSDPVLAREELLSQISLQPALIIDGLFGIGLNRPLDRDWIDLIERVNKAETPILAVDVPSGLNADTGKPQGTAIQATVTLTLAAPKRGLLASSAWPYVGRLEVAPDIGLVRNPLKSEIYWSAREDFTHYPPRRSVAAHKGTFGHAVLFAGSLGYHGAAVLAARGALKARPGLVSLFTTEATYLPIASQLQAAMVHPWNSKSSIPESASAILFGPGMADPNFPQELKNTLVRYWMEAPIPVIVDASGLDWLPSSPASSKSLRVITPHPGEAARLLKTSTAAVQESRPKALAKLSKRFGDCWVVLKGHQTIIGQNSSDIFVNSSGNPGLAQGGSGDILAGLITGFLAQAPLQNDPLTALRYAVWHHGATADSLSSKQRLWTIDDLIQSI